MKRVAVGWRIWIVPGAGEPVLHSPFRPKSERVNYRLPAWPRGTYTPRCKQDSTHEPPARGCTCGVYATENVIDILYRLDFMIHQLQRSCSRMPPQLQLQRSCSRMYEPGNWPAYVVGRVKLERVVRYDLFNSDEGSWMPELRAGKCAIDKLFVPPVWTGSWRTPEVLAGALSDRYGLPTEAGYPRITKRDRENCPQWCKGKRPWLLHKAINSYDIGANAVNDDDGEPS